MRSPFSNLMRSNWILSRSTISLLSAKSVKLQQEIEIGRRGISPSFLRVMGGPFKIRLVEIHHAGRRVGQGDGSGFENFVIERDGQFFLTQPERMNNRNLPAMALVCAMASRPMASTIGSSVNSMSVIMNPP